MSLKSWERQYYKKPACECTKEEAVQHSILKWTGLLSSNLKRHGLKRLTWKRDGALGSTIEDRHGQRFIVGISTCALCFHYHPYCCLGCPLSRARGGWPCCRHLPKEIRSPYDRFIKNGAVKPMLQYLVKAGKLV
jgi:hypothetical protein